MNQKKLHFLYFAEQHPKGGSIEGSELASSKYRVRVCEKKLLDDHE